MNYNQLKTDIIEVIRTNNDEEITGELLQHILVEMVDALGKGYLFAGVATPETQISLEDEKFVWLLGSGTYENFGETFIIQENEFAIMKFDSTFELQRITVGRPVDEEITDDSINPVESKAIYQRFEETDEDISTEVQARIDGDIFVTEHCKQYTDAETQRAQGVENDLQEQINNIVSKDTTVNLTVSPTAVFADGTDKEVMFVATSSQTKATVVFDGGEPQEGTRLEFPVTVNSAIPTTVTKTAQFTVQGVSKGSKSATVALVFPIYYGAGQSADVLNTEAMTAHSAVASPAFIQSITTADNDFIFFEVPEGMANIQRLQLWDDPSFPTDISIEAVETPREGYKAFKTVYSRLAGTHTYKVS